MISCRIKAQSVSLSQSFDILPVNSQLSSSSTPLTGVRSPYLTLHPPRRTSFASLSTTSNMCREIKYYAACGHPRRRQPEEQSMIFCRRDEEIRSLQAEKRELSRDRRSARDNAATILEINRDILRLENNCDRERDRPERRQDSFIKCDSCAAAERDRSERYSDDFPAARYSDRYGVDRYSGSSRRRY
jgi:hypothetical protein